MKTLPAPNRAGVLTRLVGKLSDSLDKYLDNNWNNIISKYSPWFEIYGFKTNVVTSGNWLEDDEKLKKMRLQRDVVITNKIHSTV